MARSVKEMNCPDCEITHLASDCKRYRIVLVSESNYGESFGRGYLGIWDDKRKLLCAPWVPDLMPLVEKIVNKINDYGYSDLFLRWDPLDPVATIRDAETDKVIQRGRVQQ